MDGMGNIYICFFHLKHKLRKKHLRLAKKTFVTRKLSNVDMFDLSISPSVTYWTGFGDVEGHVPIQNSIQPIVVGGVFG